MLVLSAFCVRLVHVLGFCGSRWLGWSLGRAAGVPLSPAAVSTDARQHCPLIFFFSLFCLQLVVCPCCWIVQYLRLWSNFLSERTTQSEGASNSRRCCFFFLRFVLLHRLSFLPSRKAWGFDTSMTWTQGQQAAILSRGYTLTASFSVQVVGYIWSICSGEFRITKE